MIGQLCRACFGFCVLLLLHLGCASTYYSRGHQALENEQYDRAIQELKQAIVEDYRNIEAIRDLGIALYQKDKIATGQKFLRLALSRRPNDLAAQYYLGLTYEAQAQTEKAIDIYRRYTEISPFNKMRKQVEGRLLVLLERQMEAQTKAMLQAEQSIEITTIPENTVAVLYFVNSTANPELDPLQKGLTEMVITDLSQVKALTVVERVRLQQLMEEMGLGMSGLIREDTAPRMGKLLGAARIVQGSITGLANQDLRIDAALTDLKKSSRQPAGEINGSLLEFYQLEKDLTFNVIETMGVSLTRQEKDAIQKIPTKNLLAFMAFCRGLDQADQGHWDAARQEFGNAVQQDPNFFQAQSQLERVEAFSSFKPGVAAPHLALADNPAPKARRGEPGPLAKGADDNREMELKPDLGLMHRTAANISSGLVPNIESRKPTTENSSTSFGASVPLQVRIRLPIKP